MKRIITTLALMLPLAALCAMPNSASAEPAHENYNYGHPSQSQNHNYQQPPVNPGHYYNQPPRVTQVTVVHRKKVWIPGHYEVLQHHRHWVAGHYVYR